MRALRRLALIDLDAGPVLLGALGDRRAAVRRAAAFGLSALPPRPAWCAPLEQAWRAESTEEGRIRLGLALARHGGPVSVLREGLAADHSRVLQTCGGPRQPTAALDQASPVLRFDLAWGDGEALDSLRARRLGQIDGDDARAAQAIWALAVLGHPDDLPVLRRLFSEAGRRGEHGLLIALGLHGDPRHQETLVEALESTRVDPGRGFAWRRLAATGLGQLGLVSAGRVLSRALTQEALEFEGRPGAGLGIQYPVRTNLLVALGEVGDLRAAPLLVGYLGNTHGSALGGFYLPAAEALLRLGPAAIPEVEAGLRGAPELLVANGVGVLGALGRDVAGWINDPRPQVADVARRVVAQRPPPRPATGLGRTSSG